ncbi:MAG: MATE family efflux transporter [Lachnospiraceae bacterium]|nr:MATE family efflux transporter [Lachnospiraceae bacterium]
MHSHSSEKRNPIEAFASDPIPQVVIKNSVPALIAMVMVMVYNIADTLFLGLTHNDYQVAAVSFAAPVFMIFMSLGTLFGVGGTSAISRALGAGQKDRARRICSFCMWSCVGVGLLLMLLLWIFTEDVAIMLGAKEHTLSYTTEYIAITVGCGVFSMLANCFSSIIRTEGEAMKAMTGTLIGNLVNLILDPIMILGLHWGVRGAAIATVIGNAVGALYYLLYFLRGKSALSISIRDFSMKDGIPGAVLSVGISASLANLLVSLSSIIVNILLSAYGDVGELYVAGYGVTSKVVMVVTLFGIGIGSGVQPMFGYCYGAKNKERLLGSIRFSVGFALAVCFAVAALCFAFAGPIVKVFLSQPDAYDAGIKFTRVLMVTGWLIGAFAICQNTLQAIGAAIPALLASVFRQGIIFIPAAFLMNAAFGTDGIIWAQPVADVLSLIVVALMLLSKLKHVKAWDSEASA